MSFRPGGWFTTNKRLAERFKGQTGEGEMLYVDVPDGHLTDAAGGMNEHGILQRNVQEFTLSDELAAKAKPLVESEEGRIAAQYQASGERRVVHKEEEGAARRPERVRHNEEHSQLVDELEAAESKWDEVKTEFPEKDKNGKTIAANKEPRKDAEDALSQAREAELFARVFFGSRAHQTGTITRTA